MLRALKLCDTSLVIVNDHLKYLANYCSATFVYTGVNLKRSGLFLEGSATERATQTSSRFSLHKVAPFEIKTAEQIREWASVIKTMEDALLLYKHKPSSLATQHWQYIHKRTGGLLTSLSELMRKSAILAVLNGEESITKTLMDRITLDGNATDNYDIVRRRPRATKPSQPSAAPAVG